MSHNCCLWLMQFPLSQDNRVGPATGRTVCKAIAVMTLKPIVKHCGKWVSIRSCQNVEASMAVGWAYFVGLSNGLCLGFIRTVVCVFVMNAALTFMKPF